MPHTIGDSYRSVIQLPVLHVKPNHHHPSTACRRAYLLSKRDVGSAKADHGDAQPGFGVFKVAPRGSERLPSALERRCVHLQHEKGTEGRNRVFARRCILRSTEQADQAACLVAAQHENVIPARLILNKAPHEQPIRNKAPSRR